MINSENIEAFLIKALAKIDEDQNKELEDKWGAYSEAEQLELIAEVKADYLARRERSNVESTKEPANSSEVEHSNVVSITSKEKASVSKAEPKLVKLFEYLPAAASSKESKYKWYHFQCEIKDNEGNKSILKMKPKGKEADKNVKLEFIPSTHNSMLDVDETYLGKWVPLVIKVADKILIEGEVFIYASKDKLIGRGKIVESEFPDTSVEPIEYFIENKL